jgi:hypothetical protein
MNGRDEWVGCWCVWYQYKREDNWWVNTMCTLVPCQHTMHALFRFLSLSWYRTVYNLAGLQSACLRHKYRHHLPSTPLRSGKHGLIHWHSSRVSPCTTRSANIFEILTHFVLFFSFNAHTLNSIYMLRFIYTDRSVMRWSGWILDRMVLTLRRSILHAVTGRSVSSEVRPSWMSWRWAD